MKRFLKRFFIAVAALLAVFFAVSYITEYRPGDITVLTEFSAPAVTDDILLPDTLKIMTWNIGYAGLGDNMDFYVDGGVKVRDTRERTERNLADIISKLKAEDADIYLIQEVDRDAHRTYGINEIEAISNAFPDYWVYFAPNFKVWFVPIPLKEPLGRVCSGVLTMSRIRPCSVRRISYPSSFSLPMRMFNLKRCLLEADFKTSDGKTAHIGNTHNTAFSTDRMRIIENEFLKERFASFDCAGEPFIIAGDWNQCPPQYRPTREELENRFFPLKMFDTTGIGSFAQILCDTTCFSMRYNDKPCSPGSTKSLLDFYVVSSRDWKPLDCRTGDFEFRSSDHNPVVLEID